MPIEFDDSRVDVGGVDDRRGGGGLGGLGGGGIALGGGAGVVGLIFLVFQLLAGGGTGGGGIQLPAGAGGGGLGASSTGQQESAEQLEQRCNTEGALDQYTDCRLIKVYNIADDVWSEEFQRRGIAYQSPRLVFFDGATQTGCGAASADVGPFYCPPDQEIYFDLNFLDQLQRQFGAQGEFAQAYIAAHEFGHHLQTVLGTERKVRAAQQRGNQNELSVAMELQADCYAGVWSTLADREEGEGIGLTQQNIAEAVNAAQAVGDDRIQQRSGSRVNPDSFTHGSAEQRAQWFQTGYRSGDMGSCDTFAG